MIFFSALWFRLSERLKLPLPLYKKFQNEIWKLILSRSCFEYYEISNDRQTPKRMDRKDFYFNTEIPNKDMEEYMKSTYFIYSFHPIDHPEMRGSCKEFATRKEINIKNVKAMSLEEIEEK